MPAAADAAAGPSLPSRVRKEAPLSVSATATSNRVLRSAALLAAGGRAHLIGAAGAGMRALTDVLYGAGWRLSGSDTSTSPSEVARWQAHGVPMFTDHNVAHVPLDA